MNSQAGQAWMGATLIRPMTLTDLPQVIAIERVSFPVPWSEQTYRKELSGNPAAHLFVALDSTGGVPDRVAGYIGFWHLVDEMHISTLAVRPNLRRGGIGRTLLKHALARGYQLGAALATLEVRESNLAAIRLYLTTGFSLQGRRPGYYRDSEEDALVMRRSIPQPAENSRELTRER